MKLSYPLIQSACVSLMVVTVAHTSTADLSGVPQIHETKEQRNERMQWFRDAKFGMFIHWGPCSVGQKEIAWGRDGNRPWDINKLGPRTSHPVYDNYYMGKGLVRTQVGAGVAGSPHPISCRHRYTRPPVALSES